MKLWAQQCNDNIHGPGDMDKGEQSQGQESESGQESGTDNKYHNSGTIRCRFRRRQTWRKTE